MLANEFGKRLRASREKGGLTQRELAERIHTQVPQISRYESGAAMPSAETLVELAAVLQVGLDELVLGQKDGKTGAALAINDVRLLERIREIEKLDRRFRDTAVAVLEAIVLQGHQEAMTGRFANRSDAGRSRSSRR